VKKKERGGKKVKKKAGPLIGKEGEKGNRDIAEKKGGCKRKEGEAGEEGGGNLYSAGREQPRGEREKRDSVKLFYERKEHLDKEGISREGPPLP